MITLKSNLHTSYTDQDPLGYQLHDKNCKILMKCDSKVLMLRTYFVLIGREVTVNSCINTLITDLECSQ